MSLTGSLVCCPVLLLDSVSMFDANNGATVQWQVHFETVNSLFNASFSSKVPGGSSVLQVGSSIYIGSDKSCFLFVSVHSNDFYNVPGPWPYLGCCVKDWRR